MTMYEMVTFFLCNSLQQKETWRIMTGLLYSERQCGRGGASLGEHSLGMVSYDKEEGRILSTRTRTSQLLVSRRVGMEQSSVCVKTKLGAHGRLTELEGICAWTSKATVAVIQREMVGNGVVQGTDKGRDHIGEVPLALHALS